MWLCIVAVAVIFFHCLTGLANAYIYCDPFSQAKMLRCVCSLLDYSDIHHYSNAFQREPLLCQRYADYKRCTKNIHPICRRTVVGHLDNVYEVLCTPINDPCRFTFSVELSYCPLKPLCEGQHCYVNDGSKATVAPGACDGHGLLLTTKDQPDGVQVPLPGEVNFMCSNGDLSVRAIGDAEHTGITQIDCAPPPPPPPPPPSPPELEEQARPVSKTELINDFVKELKEAADLDGKQD